MKRALFLLPSKGIGGAERHTASLALGLAGAGLEVTLAMEPEVAGPFRALIGKSHEVRLQTARLSASDIEAQHAASLRLVRESLPDIVIAPLPWPFHGLGIQRAAAQLRTPALMIAHLAPSQMEKSSVSDEDRALFKNASMLWVAVSRPIANRIEALFELAPGQARVIPNAVAMPNLSAGQRLNQRRSARAELGFGAADRIALFVGRLEKSKGVDLLPQLMAALDRPEDAKLVCAGDGPLFSWLSEKSRAFADNRLVVLGSRNDVSRWIDAADLLLLPSRIEGWPLVFIEAALHYCPVVATREALECFGTEAGAYASVVGDLTPLALCDAIRATLDDPRHAAQKAAQAYGRASQFDISEMISLYIVALRAVFGLGQMRGTEASASARG